LGLTHSIALPSSSPRNPIRANQKIEGAAKLESYLNLLEEVKGIFRLKKPQAVRCDSQAPVPDVSRKRSRKIESVVPEGSSRRPRCVECRSRSVDSRPVEMWISVPDVSTGQGSATREAVGPWVRGDSGRGAIETFDTSGTPGTAEILGSESRGRIAGVDETGAKPYIWQRFRAGGAGAPYRATRRFRSARLGCCRCPKGGICWGQTRHFGNAWASGKWRLPAMNDGTAVKSMGLRVLQPDTLVTL
jgi:hypothetical protein